MKLLHITPQKPDKMSGGGLCVYQSSYAWTRIFDEVDYVGPSIENEEILGLYHKVTEFSRPLSRWQKIYSLLHLRLDRNYLSWQWQDIRFDDYDMVCIEFTKMDYAIRDIRKAGYKGKIIVRAHNVEADFSRANYEANKNVRNYLQKVTISTREKYILQEADYILAITEHDKERFHEIYHVPEDKIYIDPVGINHAEKPVHNNHPASGKLNSLITGSLWFGPNANAVSWFIEEVYPEVKDIIDLTVAGARPNDKLKSLCKEQEINLIDTPVSMEPYFRKADLFIAPIFDGGGMKVKIAEAMSYNLPVVTTSHGAVGYEFTNGKNCFVSDTSEEFVKSIRTYSSMDEEERSQFLDSSWNLYKERYSLEAIEKCYADLLKKIQAI